MVGHDSLDRQIAAARAAQAGNVPVVHDLIVPTGHEEPEQSFLGRISNDSPDACSSSTVSSGMRRSCSVILERSRNPFATPDATVSNSSRITELSDTLRTSDP